MGEEKSAEIDLSKLSLSELLEHKNWKARLKGYEDITNQMQQAVSDKDAVFAKYSPGLKNWVSDTNAVALEKAVEAVHTFVECAAVAPKVASEVCPVLVQKCLAHTKQKIREKTADILMLFIEVEKADVVADALIEGFGNKNPKVVSQSVQTYKTAVSSFGIKTINVKNVMKQIALLFEHRDKDVRDQTKSLTVELHRWIGVALKSQLQNIKPVMLTELEAEFEKESSTKPAPKRYLRSQKQQMAGANAGAVGEPDSADNQGSSQAAVSAEPDVVDPWQFLPATDVLSKLPKNFYEQLESTKWAERKEYLDLLLKLLADNPKLDTACNYGELVAVLKKIISKDNNINVVGAAAKCIAALATGLRKKFGQYATMFVPIILEKFKEKKPVVATACVEAIDAVFKTTTLESISEEVVSALDNKTPSVKVQTSAFLNRAFVSIHPSILTKKLLKLFCGALVKNIGLSDPEVRDSSAAALGAAMKLVGDKNIMPFLTEIKDDHLKMDKIKEYCEKTVLENAGASGPNAACEGDSGTRETKKAVTAATASQANNNASNRNKKAAASARPQPSASSSSSSAQLDLNKNDSPDNTEVEAVDAKRPATGKSSSSARKPGENLRTKKENESGSTGSVLIDTNQKLQRFQEEKALKVLKWNFSAPTEEHIEQLKAQLATVCKPALHAQLFHTNFKMYLKALDILTQCLDSEPEASTNCSDLLLKWCTLRFFETNPSVLMKCLEYIHALLQLFVDRSLELHDIEIASFAPYLLLKSGEPKDTVRQEVRKLIQKLTKLYSATKLFPFILDGCKTKNSRQKAECLEQLGYLIDLLGVGVCGQPPQASLKAIAQNIGDKDNAVRNAALNAIVSAYNHIGDKAMKAVGTINEKEFAMLQERIKRSSKMKKPPTAAASIVNNAAGVVDSKKASHQTAPPSPPDSVPSTSSAKHLTSSSENDLRSFQQSEYESESSTGLYKLEMSKIFDAKQRASVNIPEMTLQGEDLAQMLRKPFEIPAIVKIHQASPAAKRPTQNVDAVTMLDTTISQVTSSHIYTAIQSLVQLDEILKDTSKAHFLIGKVDQLLMAIYFQLRMVYNKHMNDGTVNQNDVLCLYRHLCLVLLTLCSAGNLIKEASDGALKDLVCQLLTVLVDDRLNNTNEGAELIRSINILIVNLVTKSNNTSCLIALLRLLRDTLHSQTASNKFQELVMRCIWKLSRQLPSIADQLDLQRVLAEAHQFFLDFPSASWKMRPSNTPSRTVKTILNTLCNIFGDKILDYVGLIPEPTTSEVVHYLKKCLDEQPHNRENGHGSTVGEPGNSSTVNENPLQYKEQMSKILKKVGTKEHTKEGLVELYEFLQTHPNFDMECFYKKCSDMFRSYIQKNLKRLAAERKKETSNNDTDQETTSVTSEYAINSMETLQKLRQKCGLMPSTVTTPSRRSGSEYSEMSLPRVQERRSDAEDWQKPEISENQVELIMNEDIDNLKKRLERIKRGEF